MMDIKVKVFLIIIALFMIGSCSKITSPLETKKELTLSRELTSDEKSLIEADKNFGLKLFQSVNASDTSDNIFISPLSASMALGMTMNGAVGQTYEDMRETLEFNGLSEQEINEAYKSLIDLLLNFDEKVIFEIANSIWHEQTFSVVQTFININQKYFNAEVASLNFTDPASVITINNWVDENTHGKIKNILDEIPWDAVMYLINAIYFKAIWLYEFDEAYTTVEPFNLSDGNQSDCQLMKVTADLKYYHDQSVQIIDLPYGDGNYSMTICLPAWNINLDEFITNISQKEWNNYIENMEILYGTVELPKFKLEYQLTMNDALGAMGMAVAFDPALADFTRINLNPEDRLFISRIIHKTFVQVDEEGTEAAAVTLVEMTLTTDSQGGPHMDFHMRIDRPFFFVIREQVSGIIVFMGKISNPIWSE